ncbi:MAG: hypothetical protein ACAI38_15505 [Myxococcota bacterium]
MALTTNPIRQLLVLTDIDRPSRSEINSNYLARNFSAAINAGNAVTQGASCVPGLAVIGGWTSMTYGVAKLGFSVAALKDGQRDAAFMFFKSGAASIGLGALAAFEPVTGWYWNLVFAGKDALDTGNMIAPAR